MTRTERQQHCDARVDAARKLLNDLKRAKKPMRHSAFAQQLGISVQNFQTAQYMRRAVKELRRHNRRFAGVPITTVEPQDNDTMRQLREQLRRVLAEREDIRRQADQRIRQLKAQLDRFAAQQSLEPTVFPLAGYAGRRPADDPHIETEPEGVYDVTPIGASRFRPLLQDVSVAGLIVIRGKADAGSVALELADPLTQILELSFEDLDEPAPGADVVTDADVLKALEFANGIRGPLLVHSWAGLSRATAIAMAIVADRLGPGKETEALAGIRAVERQALPNRLVIAHADKILKRDGALLAALDERTRKHPEEARRRLERRERVLARLATLGLTPSPAPAAPESPSVAS